MTYLNAKKYIKSAPDAKQESGAHILALLEAAGNPHKRIKYLRLAGSNGKTVCAEMLSSIMSKAGHRIGFLRMPILDEPRENICIASQYLGMDSFAQLTERVRRISEKLEITLSKAEIMLAVALLAFDSKQCDLYVIESDHFGEDPSRFLPAPFAAVICGTIPNGNTSEISRIRSYIRKGVEEIVSAPQNSEAYRIISETCFSVNCRLTLPLRNQINISRMTLGGTEFSYKGREYKIKLCGEFQISNAVLALEVADMLKRKGFNIPESAVCEGFDGLTIPAKFEVISLSPIIIVDSTHTPVAIEIVCDSLANFKDTTGNKIRLCLPCGQIVNDYIKALEVRGYEIERIILPESELSPALPEKTFFAKTPKAIAKKALENLQGDTVLLISGDYPFVIPVRYQLLATLGF